MTKKNDDRVHVRVKLLPETIETIKFVKKGLKLRSAGEALDAITVWKQVNDLILQRAREEKK